MTGNGRFVEIQGTAEGMPFSKDTLNSLIRLAEEGINSLIKIQKEIIES
jgi:ribonuclease PH